MLVGEEVWDGSLQYSVFPTVQRNVLPMKEQYKYLAVLCVSVEPLHSSQAHRLEEMVKCRIHKKKNKKSL